MIRIKDIVVANKEDILYFMYLSEMNMLYIYLKGIIAPLIIEKVTPDEFDTIVGA